MRKSFWMSMITGGVGGLLTAMASYGFANPTPPPPPDVTPQIPSPSFADKSGTKVDDRLEAQASELRGRLARATSPAEQAAILDELSTPVRVQLIFDAPITQKQIDDFIALGGEIEYIYRAVSYGWNGELPLNRVEQAATVMGGSLVLIKAPVDVTLHLLNATRTGRARPVWENNFVSGFGPLKGDNLRSVGIIDTGISDDHTDITVGRVVWWDDFSSSNEGTAVDFEGHGTHVAGIAAGSGAVGGSGSTFDLPYTVTGELNGSVPENAFFPASIFVPIGTGYSVTYDGAFDGGGSTQLGLVAREAGTTGAFGGVDVQVSSSPFSGGPINFNATANLAFSTYIAQNGTNTVGNYYHAPSFTGFPGVGDGHNNMSGVAPEVNIAAAKAFANDGSGNSNWIDAALDALVADRQTISLQAINMSLGIVGDPGISVDTRTKSNNAVNNGIVVVVAAGNDGTKATTGEREIDDPGRANLVITVGASNNANTLTAFTSHGFSSPGADEDFKPDLIAPGGSDYWGLMLAADTNDGDGDLAEFRTNDYTPKKGTSMAAPFVAGAAILVAQAMDQAAMGWDYNSSASALYVKNVLLATTTETNAAREAGTGFDPTLQRAAAGPSGYPVGKDPYEGYGLINVDAAIEAVLNTVLAGEANSVSVTLDSGMFDRRAWAGRFEMTTGESVEAVLDVPVNGDFDLYLYSETPDANGNPVILASSTNAGNGVNETVNYMPSANDTGIFVVKRVSGNGEFTFEIQDANTVSDWFLLR